ncbi:MAG: hypothetical protein H6898_02575 [Rhodobacter sp.]|nr:hypothetical protein [Paracoccaceae bacterium]MCC0075456.1 hypothetical protein [Rhodobacter sp.]
MKKTLALLVASTALTAVLALPALASSGEHLTLRERVAHWFSFFDDDDHDEHRYGERRRHHDDDDDDDDDHRGPAAAPVGTVAPPANGLFGNGTPPRVQVN